MGLTKKQIKDMLPSEIEEYCKKITREKIKNRGIFVPEEKDIPSKKNSKK